MGSDDRIKGKAKEVAGKVTRDDELEAEGKAQHLKGKVTDKAEEAGDTVKGAARGLAGRDDEPRRG